MIRWSASHPARCLWLALTGEERFGAAGEWGLGSWAAAVGLGIAVTLVIVSAGLGTRMLLRRRRGGAGSRRGLDARAQQLGLNLPERNLLVRIAQQAGVASPDALFTMEEAFDRGAAALLQSPAFVSMSGTNQNQIRAILRSLRQKLGFATGPAQGTGAGVTTRNILQGAELALADPASGHSFEAAVESVGPDALVLTPLTDAGPSVGPKLQVRYANLGCVWEFDAEASPLDNGRIGLKHTDRIRLVNRRRFPRVPMRGRALLAEIGFFQKGPEPQVPQFVPSTVLEIAGPGLRFQTSLRPAARARVLAIIQLPDGKVAQGLARVRGVQPADDKTFLVAVELTDLASQETSELARQTNLAAQMRARGPAASSQDQPEAVPA